MTRYFFGAALAALSLACAPSAFAQSSTSDRQDVMVVRLSDLDTSHQAGAESALRRIKTAAGQFCGYADEKGLERKWERDSCIKRMTSKAVQSLGSTEVTALYMQTGIHTDVAQGGVQLASRDPR